MVLALNETFHHHSVIFEMVEVVHLRTLLSFYSLHYELTRAVAIAVASTIDETVSMLGAVV